MGPTKIIVEPSANHNGSITSMRALIGEAARVGADYIKFQCYTADSITIDCDREDFYIKEGPWAARHLYDLYNEAHTPREWFPQLISHCAVVGIKWFASVYCEADVDFLEDLGCPMYKIASYEIVDLPLIKYVSSTGKPMVLSTGMASEKEIFEAVGYADWMRTTLLHCISSYPTAIEDSGLNSFLRLRYKYGKLSVGISDHSLGRDVAVAATALGADVIEKHMALDRDAYGGPDAHFSMNPDEFKDMVDAVRAIHSSIEKTPPLVPPDSYSRQQRRSLYAIKDIAEGDVFTEENIRSIRPGYGLPPSQLKHLIGTKSQRAYSRGEPLRK